MPCAVLQSDLTPPALGQLQRAFRAVKRLTPLDAHTLGQDAFGILVKGFSAEDAGTLQRALQGEGVETEVVEESLLPELPPTKFVHQLECLPDGLWIHDPLGRRFSVAWGHVLLLAAGSVIKTEFVREETIRPSSNRYSSRESPFGARVDFRQHEERRPSLCLEIILTRAVARFSIAADKFNFACLGERTTDSVPENFARLVQDLTGHATQAACGRGAELLRAGAQELFHYPSRNAFYEEIVWMLWRLRQQGRL